MRTATVAMLTATILLAFSTATATLPPCQFEDSTNCYWDATTMGNGTGTSFIDLNGTTYHQER